MQKGNSGLTPQAELLAVEVDLTRGKKFDLRAHVVVDQIDQTGLAVSALSIWLA